MQEAQETQVRSLGQEDPLEEEMATHSSILAWKILWTEEPCGLQFTGSQRVGHNWAHTHTHHWNSKHAKVFPIPSRCFLLPKTRKGKHLSKESQVTKFSSPVSTLLKSWVPILEETSSWKGVFSNYILITSYTNLYQNFLDWQAE